MKLALLKGNRFNPWHLEPYRHLRGNPAVTMFRAESEIQRHFDGRDDASLGFAVERIHFDTQAGNPATRFANVLRTRYGNREPRIMPFHDRLRGFDVIQSWELFTDWSQEAAAARERYGVPLAVMVWDTIPFNMERNPRRRVQKERVAQCADRLLVHTERSRRMLALEGAPADRVVNIPPGVDLEVFSPGPGGREGLGLSGDDFVILFVGWLLPRKGIDFLILALRELLHDPALEGRKVRLLIVGSGPGQDRVERLIARTGVAQACIFAGALPYSRMPAVFRSADVFVLPSVAAPEWQEQFGMSLIEAMACGVPAIATLTGAVEEIAGGAAALCQPNDFPALHAALRGLMLDDGRRQALAAAGRARAVACFDVRRTASALSAVYEDLLGGSVQ